MSAPLEIQIKRVGPGSFIAHCRSGGAGEWRALAYGATPEGALEAGLRVEFSGRNVKDLDATIERAKRQLLARMGNAKRDGSARGTNARRPS